MNDVKLAIFFHVGDKSKKKYLFVMPDWHDADVGDYYICDSKKGNIICEAVSGSFRCDEFSLDAVCEAFGTKAENLRYVLGNLCLCEYELPEDGRFLHGEKEVSDNDK